MESKVKRHHRIPKPEEHGNNLVLLLLFLKQKQKLGIVLSVIIVVFLFTYLALWSSQNAQHIYLRQDPPAQTFYDDPKFNYSIENPIQNWDEKRMDWLLKHHPSYAFGSRDRVLMLTGSQSSPCKSRIGDFFLLRLFRNKVDYCRIHGYDIFYNTAFLHPKMNSHWAKPPIIRAAMLAHPEAEWIWWVDIDAVITDVELKLPLDKYKNHNLVADGWPDTIYKKRSWYGLNSGVLLFRNCQWSMDFLDVWASMGPASPDYEKWGHIFQSTLTDRKNAISTDQTAMVYMLLKQKDKWAGKVYLENEYCFQCYWAMAVNWFNNVTNNYMNIERSVSMLRRRHAEVVSESYGEMKEKYLKEAGYRKKSERRPFITHFTGCSPCRGHHDPMYTADSCRDGMERALNFADNQVLRNFGFVHPSLLDTSSVLPLPFDAPSM